MKKCRVLFLTAALAFYTVGCGSTTTQTSAVGTADETLKAQQSENTTSQEAKEEKEVKPDFPQKVVYDCEKGRIRLDLPEEAVYTIEEYTGLDSEFGICFRLNEKMDGEVFVGYQNSFAVCGTELEETETTINGMPARMGVYDQAPYWSFLVLTEEYTDYVIKADGAESWWEGYGEQVMQVLETLSIDRK